jgi:hypothetical protein
VKLTRLGHHTFRATFWAAESLAGKRAYFQRYTSHGWKTLKIVRLAQTGASGPTIVSGATFRSGVAHHQKVRMLITRSQVGNCYLPGWRASSARNPPESRRLRLPALRSPHTLRR